ncbi:MAG: hypothetical protein WDM94_12295 [Bauldia sp.]
MEQLFIDDDVVGGVEVMPAGNAAWVAEQMAAIARHSAAHRTAYGWSDMYVRPPAPADVERLGIPFAAAVDALAPLFPPIGQVVTGRTDRPQIIARAKAFGPSLLTAAVLYRQPAGTAIQTIELTLRGSDTEQEAVLSALAALPSPEPLMVVDWDRARAALFGDSEAIGRFIAS